MKAKALRRGANGSFVVPAIVILLLLVCVVLLALPYLQRPAPVPLTTEYQAVLLNNGQVYFGKIEGLGSTFPVLREVYYVQNKVNPATKEVVNVLVRRGKELHAPEYMVLNANYIVLIEPVGPDSQVARLIAESKKETSSSK